MDIFRNPFRQHAIQKEQEEKERQERLRRKQEFFNSAPIQDLATKSRQNGGLPVEFKLFAPQLERIDQNRENDPVGCVVACYRMMMQLQGKKSHDGTLPSQMEVRQRLSQNQGLSRGLMSEAMINSHSAGIAGVENPMQVQEFEDGITYEENQRLIRENWQILLALALSKGYGATVSLPMKQLYKDGGDEKHAIMLYGMRWDKNGLSYIVHDPLKPNNTSLNSDVFGEYEYAPMVVLAPKQSRGGIKLGNTTEVIK